MTVSRAISSFGFMLMIGVVLWTVVGILRRRRADVLFGAKRRGGRSGEIEIRCGNRTAMAEYEIGGTVDLIVYGESLRWVDSGTFSADDRDNVIAALNAWAAKRGSSLIVGA